MARQEPAGRGAVVYWLGLIGLLILMTVIAWLVFQPPSQLGI